MNAVSTMIVEIVTLTSLAACAQGFNKHDLTFTGASYSSGKNVYLYNPLED